MSVLPNSLSIQTKHIIQGAVFQAELSQAFAEEFELILVALNGVTSWSGYLGYIVIYVLIWTRLDPEQYDAAWTSLHTWKAARVDQPVVAKRFEDRLEVELDPLLHFPPC